MVINGKEKDFPNGITVSELLQQLKIEEDKVVVEVDKEIISKDTYISKELDSSSKVELIRFVGGG